ncbi:MAG: lipoprotein signal peptidase [Bacteroidaceae bacterium]|nr:lipoprotein signal peptidase [Bacteroidaceae bacterium]
MTKERRQCVLATVIIVAVIVIDQLIKFGVKLNFSLHENLHITDWFYILFVENNGAAFGMELIHKLFLTLFRIAAVVVLVYYLVKQIHKKARTGYVSTLALIIAGAAGNIFDCIFYGKIFTASTPYTISRVVRWGDGYGELFMGKVVDMFYFPLIETTWPEWMPWCGGERFVFFSPVFNFADSAITCGIIILLIWFRKELSSLSFS